MLSLNDIISNPDQLFTVSEIADACGVTRQAVDLWCRKGKLEYVVIGNNRESKGEWVEDYLVEAGKKVRAKYQKELSNEER